MIRVAAMPTLGSAQTTAPERPKSCRSAFRNTKHHPFHGPISAWAVLLLGLLVTAAAWHTSVSALNRAVLERFNVLSEEISHAIETRMILYEQVLWGGIGLFNASNDVSRDQFHRYITALNIDTHWPGIQAVGFSIPVPTDQIAQHEQNIRAEGFPEYRIHPQDFREAYTAIIYIEPFDWRNQRAFGYDMHSNALRREAMVRSVDSGSAITSGVITLVQETQEDVQRGFLTYAPLYRSDAILDTSAKRRDAHLGWVYAAFRMGDLMSGLTESHREGIGFTITDVSEAAPQSLYEKLLPSPPEALIESEHTLFLQGRQWQINFSADAANLPGMERHQPTLVAIAGLAVDLLLFYIISSLARMRGRAEELVDERTAELVHSQGELEQKIRESESLVEALTSTNEELSQFAYVASHDMKEPLRMISNFTSLLEDEYNSKLDENGRLYLKMANESASRMLMLVTDLLEYSRVDRESDRMSVVSSDKQVDFVCEDLRSSIEQYGATIRRETPLPNIIANPVRLKSLFQNLLSNALKYHRDGVPPEISIGAIERDNSWEFYVRDNGIGIEDSYHERIFQPFKRLHSADEYSGSGVGLAICKKIISAMEGSIWLESTPGTGSCFYFTLRKSDNPLTGSD